MKIGVLVTGDTAVRAAHSLSGSPHVDDIVVVGPATSKNFRVVDTAEDCDVLIGSGPKAPRIAARHGLPLVWDGMDDEGGAVVWGASPQGLALAIASRETDPRLVAVAHPSLEPDGTVRVQRFPSPIGQVSVSDQMIDGKPVASATSKTYGAVLVEASSRNVTMIDNGAFMSGIALAAGIACLTNPGAVWDHALSYLEMAAEMGLVMAEGS